MPISIAWAWTTVYGMGSMIAGGISATVLLTSVTLWTGVVFWRERARISSGASPVLAGAFILWGLHHLDYPLLRGFGAAVLYGVFADVLFLFAIGLGLLFVVLGNERDRLAERTSELEQLTGLVLRVQEDERRRIAQELHDEAGQVLTAVKIELELDGRHDAGAMVGRALAQVRDLSNLLRPSVLDDLGLAPALRALAEDFAARTRIAVAPRSRRRRPAARPGGRSGALPRRPGSAHQRRQARRRGPGAGARGQRRARGGAGDRGRRARRRRRRPAAHGMARHARTGRRAGRPADHRPRAATAASASTPTSRSERSA